MKRLIFHYLKLSDWHRDWQECLSLDHRWWLHPYQNFWPIEHLEWLQDRQLHLLQIFGIVEHLVFIFSDIFYGCSQSTIVTKIVHSRPHFRSFQAVPTQYKSYTSLGFELGSAALKARTPWRCLKILIFMTTFFFQSCSVRHNWTARSHC